jgi:hypothetical protein
VITDRAPGLVESLTANADDAGYVRALYERVIDAAFSGRAQEVGHALSLAAIADEETTDESDWLLEAAGE